MFVRCTSVVIVMLFNLDIGHIYIITPPWCEKLIHNGSVILSVIFCQTRISAHDANSDP